MNKISCLLGNSSCVVCTNWKFLKLVLCPTINLTIDLQHTTNNGLVPLMTIYKLYINMRLQHIRRLFWAKSYINHINNNVYYACHLIFSKRNKMMLACYHFLISTHVYFIILYNIEWCYIALKWTSDLSKYLWWLTICQCWAKHANITQYILISLLVALTDVEISLD